MSEYRLLDRSVVPRGRVARLACIATIGITSAAALFAAFLPARAAETSSASRPPMPALPQVEAKDQPGLALTIESLAPGAPKAAISDTRISRMLALYVPAGTVPSSFSPAGPFRATFEGDLTLRIRDFYGFFAEGRGKLTLKINDKVVLETSGEDLSSKKSEPVRLNKGKNHVVAIYESAASGDAAIRMFWIPKGLTSEPVPPMALSHSGADKAAIEGERVRQGRFLAAQYRCIKCHAPSSVVSRAGAGAMPELAQDAPSFKEIGARLNAGWMAAWINNPRAMRNRVHMPRIFHGSSDDEAIDSRARDVAAYLATLGGNAPAGPTPDPKKHDDGGRAFTHLNCVACHISPERSQPGTADADAGRISLEYVKAKFKPAALVQFLLKPEAHYAWIPMPNFHLTEDEAQSLTAYLLSFPGKAVDAGVAGNAASGEKLLKSSGCLNCHAMDEKTTNAGELVHVVALDSIPADGWTRGCMATDGADRKNAPDFGLSEEERTAILAFAATDRSSLARDCAPEFAERQIAAMRCIACHARDGKESLMATVLDAENQELQAKYPPVETSGQEGIAPDQRAPMITWAGEKLLPDWMAGFIGGQITYKPRYYLMARMPAFAARAKGLSMGLVQEHGCPIQHPPYPPANAELAAVGQKLAGKAPNESFGCVQCHAIGNQPPLAPFEAPAPNFMYVTDRLRQDYYYRWMHNPLRIDPESKMPRFDDDEGKTGITTILGGDGHKQFEALWNYMRLGKEIKPPAQ